MKYDFVFICEIKNRELESIILLKCELEKRGYSVYIVETWEGQIHAIRLVDSKVVVAFALYKDTTIQFIRSFVKSCEKLINMQWEQVYTNGDAKREFLSHDTSYGIRGKAVEAVHICWGENNYKRLTEKYGVDSSKAIMAGNVTLDFLRKEFASFYLSRDQLLSKYKIDCNCKVYMFVSSFSYVNMPNTLLSSPLYQNVGFNINEFAETSLKSQAILLEWFEVELEKHPDVTIIYRPHPAENDNEKLKLLENKYTNFRVIGELSIKQWIIIVDKIYAWWSTSVAEIYAAGKGCEILRPVTISRDAELEYLNESTFINTFEEFDDRFEDCNPEFPIPDRIMKSYYLINDVPTYIRLVDAFERIIKDPLFDISLPDSNNAVVSRKVLLLLKRFLFGNKYVVKAIKPFLGEKIKYHGRKYNDLLSEYQYAVKMSKNNCLSQKEIDSISEKIKTCMREFEK